MSLSANLEKLRKEEYAAQFFGFSPSLFFEDLAFIFSDRLREGADSLEKNLQKIPPNIIPPEEIAQGVQTLRQQSESNCQKTVEKLRTHILDNILKIPAHVLLPGDVEQGNQVSASDITLLQAEIDSLHLQLKNEIYMAAKYKEEFKDIKEVLTQQRNFEENYLGSTSTAFKEDMVEKFKFLQENVSDIRKAASEHKDINVGLQNVCPEEAHLADNFS